MAEMLPRVEPMVCLRWVTERPYSGASRKSPDFCVLQRAWHLEMDLAGDGDCQSLICAVWLRPSPHPPVLPPPSRFWLNYVPDIDCRLEIKGKSFPSGKDLDIKSPRTCIFKRDMLEDEIRPSNETEEWTVLCKFLDTEIFKCFSLQVGGETVHFSSEESRASPPKTEDRGVQVSTEVPRDAESLSSDFSHLLQEEILPDVELECSGRTFRAHRSVLAARSQVLRAMFQNKMLESQSGTVKIRDMDVPVLEKFLKFLYSGRPDELSEECAAQLYAAADKYDVPSLKIACAYWTTRNLTLENCVTFLKMAETHCDGDLKAAVVAFVVENPSVMRSGAWLELSRELPSLAVEVLQTYFDSTVL